MANVWYSVPPFEQIRLPGTTPPPLGTFLLCDLGGGAAAVHAAVAHHHRAPWTPVVLLARPHGQEDQSFLLEALQALPGQPAFMIPDPAELYPDPVVALFAVRQRPAPDYRMVTTYIEQRTGDPTLGQLIITALDRESVTGPIAGLSYRTLCRRLRRHGPLSVEDWRTLYRLGMHAGAGDLTVEVLARRYDAEPRTLRAQVRRYLGASLSEYRERPGWEWVTEAALRRFEYVDRNEQQLREA